MRNPVSSKLRPQTAPVTGWAVTKCLEIKFHTGTMLSFLLCGATVLMIECFLGQR